MRMKHGEVADAGHLLRVQNGRKGEEELPGVLSAPREVLSSGSRAVTVTGCRCLVPRTRGVPAAERVSAS